MVQDNLRVPPWGKRIARHGRLGREHGWTRRRAKRQVWHRHLRQRFDWPRPTAGLVLIDGNAQLCPEGSYVARLGRGLIAADRDGRELPAGPVGGGASDSNRS